MFARWRIWSSNYMFSLFFILWLTIQISTVIYRLKTISINIIRLHFHNSALFAQNCCTKIYMQTTLHLRANGQSYTQKNPFWWHAIDRQRIERLLRRGTCSGFYQPDLPSVKTLAKMMRMFSFAEFHAMEIICYKYCYPTRTVMVTIYVTGNTIKLLHIIMTSKIS